MKILWLAWKDIEHPLAGGAEVVGSELAKRLVKDGHEIIFLTGGFKGAEPDKTIDGYKVIRLGNRWAVYWKAYRYYKEYLKGWADLVIDETNTIPFFAKFYVKEPNILLIHQLCRQIWFYQLPKPLGLIGYIAEPIYLRLLSNKKVITVSHSTKNDLKRYGFKANNISIISEGIQISPVKDLKSVSKYKSPTVLSLGSIRAMKRTLDQVKAFELAKEKISDLKLKIAGDASGDYGNMVLDYIKQSPHKKDIEYLGRVTSGAKQLLMQKSHLIMVTSIKEGWGLVVTEAASQGTPAVVYNVDGLRDSVINSKTGLISKENKPTALAESIDTLLSDESKYNSARNHAWEFSKLINFDTSYKQFNSKIRG